MATLPLNLVQCRISCATASLSASSQRPKCELSSRTTTEPMHGSFPAPSFPTDGPLTTSTGATSPQLLSDYDTNDAKMGIRWFVHGNSPSHQAKGKEENLEFCFATTCARLGLVGLAAAALCYTFPALAYRGGGPYGMEVTRGQDLTGKDFSGRALIKQDFKTSILRQANFKGAKLLGASFFDSDLTGADLTDADLRFADFSLANVAKANLTNANLEGALVTGNTSFKGAIITGADFTDVLWRDDQRNQLCLSAAGVNSNTGHATRETLLCE